jgi:hypothetical protein
MGGENLSQGGPEGVDRLGEEGVLNGITGGLSSFPRYVKIDVASMIFCTGMPMWMNSTMRLMDGLT